MKVWQFHVTPMMRNFLVNYKAEEGKTNITLKRDSTLSFARERYHCSSWLKSILCFRGLSMSNSFSIRQLQRKPWRFWIHALNGISVWFQISIERQNWCKVATKLLKINRQLPSVIRNSETLKNEKKQVSRTHSTEMSINKTELEMKLR